MNPRSYVMPVGRLLLALIFIVSGTNKLVHWSQSAAFMASKGLPLVPLLLGLAAVIELVGGLMVLIGYRADLGALALFVYLIPVTLVFHAFWGLHGMDAQMQMVNFLKNLSIMGGLLTVAASSPTPISVDAARARKHPPGATPSAA